MCVPRSSISLISVCTRGFYSTYSSSCIYIVWLFRLANWTNLWGHLVAFSLYLLELLFYQQLQIFFCLHNSTSNIWSIDVAIRHCLHNPSTVRLHNNRTRAPLFVKPIKALSTGQRFGSPRPSYIVLCVITRSFSQ